MAGPTPRLSSLVNEALGAIYIIEDAQHNDTEVGWRQATEAAEELRYLIHQLEVYASEQLRYFQG